MGDGGDQMAFVCSCTPEQANLPRPSEGPCIGITSGSCFVPIGQDNNNNYFHVKKLLWNVVQINQGPEVRNYFSLGAKFLQQYECPLLTVMSRG